MFRLTHGIDNLTILDSFRGEASDVSYWMVSSGIGFAQKIYACDAVVIDRSDNFVLICGSLTVLKRFSFQ